MWLYAARRVVLTIPVLVDRMDIGGLGRGKTARYAAFGSVLLAVPGRADGVEALAQALTAASAAIPGLHGAASALPGGDVGIGARLAARDFRAVTAGIRSVWIAVRHRLCSAPPASRRKGGMTLRVAPDDPSFMQPIRRFER